LNKDQYNVNKEENKLEYLKLKGFPEKVLMNYNQHKNKTFQKGSVASLLKGKKVVFIGKERNYSPYEHVDSTKLKCKKEDLKEAQQLGYRKMHKNADHKYISGIDFDKI